jgi:hypothetical protein
VDTKGLSLFAMVTPADMTDRDAAKEVLFRLRLMHPDITIVWADSGYAGKLRDTGDVLAHMGAFVLTLGVLELLQGAAAAAPCEQQYECGTFVVPGQIRLIAVQQYSRPVDRTDVRQAPAGLRSVQQFIGKVVGVAEPEVEGLKLFLRAQNCRRIRMGCALGIRLCAVVQQEQDANGILDPARPPRPYLHAIRRHTRPPSRVSPR